MRNKQKALSFLLFFVLIITSFVPVGYAASGENDNNNIQVATGWNFTVALKSDGSVWAWGSNCYGQLGDGTNEDKTVPTKVKDLEDVVKIAAGTNHALALKDDGSLWAWGYNYSGQVGDGTKVNRVIPVKVMDDISTVTAGELHTLALTVSGQVYSWGSGYGYGKSSVTPTTVEGIGDVKQIAAGYRHNAVLKNDGTVWLWGDNRYGQLGDGTLNGRGIPAPAMSLDGTSVLNNVKLVDAGEGQTIAVHNTGSMYSWGRNLYGELGYDTSRATPGWVNNMSNVVSAATGAMNSAGIWPDGTLWMWGSNSKKQVSDSTMSGIKLPTLGRIKNVQQADMGLSHVVVLGKDGSVWTWGDNSNGQLGDGTTTDRTTPVKVSFPEPVTEDKPPVDPPDEPDAVPVKLEASPYAVSILNGTSVLLPELSAKFDDGSTEVVQGDWESQNASVVDVNDGMLVGKSPGMAVVLAKYGENLVVPVKVTVTPRVERLEVTGTSLNVEVGKVATFKVVAHLENDKTLDVTKSVDLYLTDPSIAAVKNNTIRGVARGTTSLVVAYNGYCESKNLTVIPTIITLKPSVISLAMKVGGEAQLYASAVYTGGVTEDVSLQCTWTSLAPNIAVVDLVGFVAARNPGTTYISVQYGSKVVKIKVVVTK